MPRPYTSDEAAAEFTKWLLVLGGVGAMALWDAIRPRPSPYMPVAPDNPTQVNPFAPLTRMLKTTKIDFSSVKPPKVNLSDAGGPRVSWAKENRPKIEKLGSPEATNLPAVLPQLPTSYRIYPAQVEAEYTVGVTLLQTLLLSCPRLTFEIVAEAGRTYWQITDPLSQYPSQTIIDHVKSRYPGATVEVLAPWDSVPKQPVPFYRQLLLFGLANEYAVPLPFLEMLKASDPLATLVQRLAFLNTAWHERISYQLQVVVPTGEALRKAYDRLGEGMVKALSGLVFSGNKQDPIAGLDLPFLNAKLAGPLFHCFLSVVIETTNEQRLVELAELSTILLQFRTDRHNAIRRMGGQALKRRIDTVEEANLAWFDTLLTTMVRENAGQWRDLLLVLCPAEIASLWHLPNATFTAQNIVWATAQAPDALISEAARDDRVVIGETVRPGHSKPVSIALMDRAYHQTLIGKTGTGKSTLLHHLIRQDIVAGRGVAVLDPHGKLIDDILSHSIPKKRLKDVVLLECGRTEYPVPLNPFRVPAGISYTRAFDYLLWVLEKLYERIWREGQTELIMRNVLAALLCDPDATPLDIARLFTNDGYRQQVVNQLAQHPDSSTAVLHFWRDEFPLFSEGERQRLFGPIRNRTGAFLGRRHMENMTCHPATVDFTDCIANQKIVLINLAGKGIQVEAGTLGALLLSGFYMASEALGYLPDNTLPRCYVYADDIERLITSPLPDMFSQARKFGLSLTLTNQYLDQLPSDTLRGILGNAGTLMVFEVGERDAQALARSLAPAVTPDDLVTLGVHRMAVKTRAQGTSVPAFVAATRDKPPVLTRAATAHAVRQQVAKTFLPAQAVRAWLDARYLATPAPPAGQAAAGKPPAQKRKKKALEDYE